MTIPTNFVLVDFENVQPKDIDLLKDGPFKVKVFLGPNQSKIPVSFTEALQPLGEGAEYIILETAGNNALDFLIAYYIGVLSAVEPTAFFHIISKDSGFDPLLKYLKGKKIFVQRYTCIADIPYFKKGKKIFAQRSTCIADIPYCKPTFPAAPEAQVEAVIAEPAALEAQVEAVIAEPAAPEAQVEAVIAEPAAPEAQVKAVIADLVRRKTSKPRTQKTLLSTLHALFKKELSEQQLDTLFSELCKRGIVKVEGTKVSYALPTEP